MAQVTFGTILREARERKGYDLATAARRLRIRPDILRAIEEDDFSRMPPRGYARNMVNAYARLVGLNPTEMTRMYLDEAYAYQVGRARNDAQPSGFDRGGSSRTARSSARQGARPAQQADERPPRQNALGRTMYDDRRDYGRDYGTRSGGAGRLYSEDRTHPSRHAALPNAEYTNFYAGPKASSVVQSKLPFIIAGGVILVLLVVVLVLVFGNNGGGSNEDMTKLPVTGLTDPTQDGSGSDGSAESAQPQPAPKETAPTSLKVTYSIAKNTPVYAVITQDGVATDQMFSGGEEDTVELTEGGTWSFAAWASDGVTITADGEAVEFDGADASGMPMATVDFDAYLEQWYEDHPDAKKKDAGDTDAAGDSDAGGAGEGSATGDGSQAT
ncbi:helix-turn-helix domain-containing protein [Eggerthella timonensis]|uniref:helix-turn-helix domain-containing protein n=1 Tax=Eggerthella timonensis TaxID=1871008 RepID=UPI001FE5AAAA|nr:helix-turn-helix transcriptional regulator [Eggerthella timonensis]